LCSLICLYTFSSELCIRHLKCCLKLVVAVVCIPLGRLQYLRITWLSSEVRPVYAIECCSTPLQVGQVDCHDVAAGRPRLESLDSDSSRTPVPILLDSDSSPSHLDSDSRHAARTVGTRRTRQTAHLRIDSRLLNH